MLRPDLARVPADRIGSAPAVRLFLSEHFARETEPDRLIAAVCETIGRYLHVARVGYGEIDQTGEWMTVPVDWVDGVPSRAERRPFDRGDTFSRMYAEGRTLIAPDVTLEPWYEEQRRYLAAEHVRACLGVPVIDNGRLVAVFNAIHNAPRRWTEEEVVTLAHAGERLWGALQHLRTLRQLRESEEQFRTLAENVPALCWLADERGKPIWGNHAWQAFFGETRAARGDAGDGVLHPDDHERATAGWQRAIATGEPIELTVRMRGREGPYRPFLSRSVPIRGEDGEVRRWCGTIVDLTGQQEQARREAFLVAWSDAVCTLEAPRDIMAHTLDQIGRHLGVSRANYAEASADGAALTVEQVWCEGVVTVTGQAFPLAALGDRVLADHLSGAPVRVCDTHADPRFDAGNRVLYDEVGVRALVSVPMLDGGRIAAVLTVQQTEPRNWTDAECDLLRDLADRTWAVVARARAEVALRRSRETLYQTEKLSALGSLLAGVSHELNNPLSIVVAQAVMMERQGQGTPLAERAGKIRKAADRCARIVQTFLAMARQKTPERRPVDLNAIAAAALELTDYGLRADGIASERELAADLPPIPADSDQLHQIVVNLIVNAQQAMVDHSSPERRLTLRTRRAAEAVVLEIADTGPGIPEALRRRVFEPFYTTKPQGQGTGVGLSFSQGLAEAHGGRLELAPSEAGACFRLTLPIDEGQVLPAVAPEPTADVAVPTRRALVVDDEAEIAEALGDFLSLEGYEAEIAVGGAAAIERLRAGDYDLIVSDLRMPGIDGPALHAWVAAERPELLGRMAFTTGDTLGAAVARFLDEVRRPVLEKPFMPDGVRRFLEAVVAA